jgi:hypothetical protein
LLLTLYREEAETFTQAGAINLWKVVMKKPKAACETNPYLTVSAVLAAPIRVKIASMRGRRIHIAVPTPIIREA